MQLMPRLWMKMRKNSLRRTSLRNFRKLPKIDRFSKKGIICEELLCHILNDLDDPIPFGLDIWIRKNRRHIDTKISKVLFQIDLNLDKLDLSNEEYLCRQRFAYTYVPLYIYQRLMEYNYSPRRNNRYNLVFV